MSNTPFATARPFIELAQINDAPCQSAQQRRQQDRDEPDHQAGPHRSVPVTAIDGLWDRPFNVTSREQQHFYPHVWHASSGTATSNLAATGNAFGLVTEATPVFHHCNSPAPFPVHQTTGHAALLQPAFQTFDQTQYAGVNWNQAFQSARTDPNHQPSLARASYLANHAALVSGPSAPALPPARPSTSVSSFANQFDCDLSSGDRNPYAPHHLDNKAAARSASQRQPYTPPTTALDASLANRSRLISQRLQFQKQQQQKQQPKQPQKPQQKQQRPDPASRRASQSTISHPADRVDSSGPGMAPEAPLGHDVARDPPDWSTVPDNWDSNKYEEPAFEGTLVGQRQPTSLVAAEYATADPIYKTKTTALVAKYSQYRNIGGDGSCGWRAVCIGWLEVLIQMDDTIKLVLEEARIRSLANVMIQAGYNEFIIETFADSFFSTMRKIGNGVQNGNAEQVLLDLMNDDMTQKLVITYIRTLTAAWMLTHENQYAPFLTALTLERYTEVNVLPVHAEIDHLSLSALRDVLLAPAGIALDVMYLDLSPGTEVTKHHFDPDCGIEKSIGLVTLLYRPGHYDLLYPCSAETSSNPRTFLQLDASPIDDPVMDLTVSDCMTSIPGMSYAGGESSWMPAACMQADMTSLTTPTSIPVPSLQAPRARPPSAATASMGTTHRDSNTTFVSHQLAMPHVPLETPRHPSYVPLPPHIPVSTITHEIPFRPIAPETRPTPSHSGNGHEIPDSHQQMVNGPFRPSIWQFDSDNAQPTFQVPFQTSIFRNSHFNTAHFLNPEFQPEQWDPTEVYITVKSGGKISRRRANE